MILPKKGFLGIEQGLSATYFVVWIMDAVINSFFPKILEEKGFTSAQIGELRSISFCVVISAPFLYAIISDRLHNKRLALQIGSWIAGLTVIILFANWGFCGYAFLLVIQSFFQQGTENQLDSLSLNTLPNKNNYGRVRTWGSLGYLFSLFTVGLMADHYGLLNIFWYMIVIQIILMGIVLLLPSDNKTIEEIKQQKQENTQQENSKTSNFPIKIGFIFLILFVITLFISQGIYNNFFMIYLTTNLHYSNTSASTIIGLGVGFEIVGLILSVFILKRFKIRTLLFTVGLMSSFRWLLQGFESQHLWILIFSQSLQIFTLSFTHTTVLKYIKENFEDYRHVAIAIGIYGSAGLGLGNALGSFIIGHIWDFGPHISFSFCIVFAIISAIIGLCVNPKLGK